MYAYNLKDKVIEWNEQDKAERVGERGSKSRQCEYAVHKYESGLLNLQKIPATLLLMGLVGVNGIVTTFLCSCKSSRAWNFSKLVSC
jgi:hypothetical protein